MTDMTPFQEILAHGIVYGGIATAIIAPCIVIGCALYAKFGWYDRTRTTDSAGAR